MTAGQPPLPILDNRLATARRTGMGRLTQAKQLGKMQDVAGFVDGYSIEVMPRTAAKIADFRELLPSGTRIYIANIDGTPFCDMLETARRIVREGFSAVPHITARTVQNEAELRKIVQRYREAGVKEALLLAGGISKPRGEYQCTMQLLESRIFDGAGFTRVFVAGHPEGNRDIDVDGGHAELDKALLRKQEFALNSGMELELTTQFAFDADAVVAWVQRIRNMGVELPVNIGVAGPAKLQTLLKFAISCGVGPSIRVIQRRGRDFTKLLAPFTPDDMVSALAEFRHNVPDSMIAGLHIFPLGGIRVAVDWAAEQTVGGVGNGIMEHDQ